MFYRPSVVELVVLAVITVTSSMLIVFVPASRVYCGIALALVLVYGMRLWRFLPREKRRVTTEAYRMADAMLMARQEALASSSAVKRAAMSPMMLPQPQQRSMSVSMMLPQHQQAAMSPMMLPQPQQRSMSVSMMLPQHQQAAVSPMMLPQPQQRPMSVSMMLPQHQQAAMSPMMLPQPQQRFVSMVPPAMPSIPATGNMLPQLPQTFKNNSWLG